MSTFSLFHLQLFIFLMFNKPGVAGAVLQKPLSLID